MVQEHASGVNPLKTMMEKVSELAGLSVKYTNIAFKPHLLPGCFKIVAEVTGHKSMKALQQYEHTTEQQFQVVGSSITVMDAFGHEQVPPDLK